MPTIAISALITTGEAVLFLAPVDASGDGAGFALPRCVLGDDDDSIEEALAAHLRESLSIAVVEQEFIETVYEREAGSDEIRLNNVQLVTVWEGEPVARGAAFVPTWVPVSFVAELDLPAGLREVALPALGLASPQPEEAAAEAQAPAAIIVTGPAGAGKTTIARLLAERRARAALVSLDALMDLVVTGAPLPHWHGGDEAAARAHIRLVLANAAALAQNFGRAGFDCVIEGVLETPEELDALLAGLGGADAYFVSLTPEAAELTRRDQTRPPEERMGARSLELHAIFRFNGELRGLRIDSSLLDPEETVDLILDHLEEARLYH